ncbi:MAG: TetR/AcrR family transcriptional regulator [Caulobacteraceae bacterium]|nr:TetR/AcrR family transcriptional regulator [Caulobacteraceae bacterium]
MESAIHIGAPPPGRRKLRKAPMDRRRDLLAMTISCLATLGPRGATGREICRRAGVSHGLLRHYFDNPETLFLEAYKDLCDRFLAEFERRLLDESLDPWRALDTFFEVLFSETWANSEVLGAWTAFWTLTRSDEAFAEVNAAHNDRLRELLELALRRLPGPCAPGVDYASATMILSSVMDGLWLEFCLRPEAPKRAEAVELCRLTLRRLMAR